MAYEGFFYTLSGQQIYPTPRESPGRYRPRPLLNREIKRSISQYDHAELVSLSASLCCRIPALRAAIRDKNSWAFANWLPVYLGKDEKWGDEAEEYLTHEVLPNCMFRELRQDFTWGTRICGMGMDMYGDDLCFFTEDEQHNPKLDIIPAPRIGSGLVGNGWLASLFSGAFATSRSDGQGVVSEGEFRGLPIYNGIIRKDGIPIAARILGYDDAGMPSFNDFRLGMSYGTHYGCEMEFFGQGRGIPRISASVLHWMNKEDIDDQLMKGLKNAAERTVIHKIPAGQDAVMARGNAIEETKVGVAEFDSLGNPILDGAGNIKVDDRTIYIEKTQDGTVTYIGSDEDLAGLNYENPSKNTEAFAMRVLMECLSDVGWSFKLLASDGTSGAPTRLEMHKANNSISERQSLQEIRSIKFFQYAIAKGMANGRLSPNRNGIDPYKWGIGFPATLTVDSGNEVKAALDRLKMGLTNERIEASKEGYIAKRILAQRQKEIKAKIKAADDAYKFVQTLGHKDFTFQQAMELFYQPNPNSAAVNKIMEPVTNPQQPDSKSAQTP